MKENFSWILPGNEGIGIVPQSLYQLEIRDPKFSYFLISLIVTPIPGEINRKGNRADIIIAGSIVFQLCQGGCAGAIWELPVVMAG